MFRKTESGFSILSYEKFDPIALGCRCADYGLDEVNKFTLKFESMLLFCKSIKIVN